MRSIVVLPAGLALAAAAVAGPAAPPAAQPDPGIVVNGRPLPTGPDVKGVVTARHGDRLTIATADGGSTTVTVTEATRVKAGGGLFGGGHLLPATALLTGLPVEIKTWTAPGADGQAAGGLVAAQVKFRQSDLRTATMIHGGTAQGFAEQSAATAALKGRLGDLDKYNIKSTTNVHFATGRTELSATDKAELCSAATAADAVDNALILVVGYTDSTGGDDLNQRLSEQRANRVINYLQQACGWKPYRMLTPTGMAKADPAATNATPEGKAQNRRVAVNVLVSKSVDGL